MANLPNGSGMIATEVASPFLTPFKLSMYAAFFLAMPVILHQMWAFVSPGLYLREKRFALPLLVSSVLLYYLGMAFAYYLVFPLVFKFFAGITPVGVTMMTDINHYLEFVLGLFFAFGFTFEIPIATFLIVSTGLTTTKSLTEQAPLRSRWLLRRRHDPHARTGRDIADHARGADVDSVRTRRVLRAHGRAERANHRSRGSGTSQGLSSRAQLSRNVTGPSLTKATCMSAPKRPVSTRPTRCRTRSTNTSYRRAGLIRRRRRRETRSPAIRRVGRQRELRDHQHRAADVDDASVHRLGGVGKDP